MDVSRYRITLITKVIRLLITYFLCTKTLVILARHILKIYLLYIFETSCKVRGGNVSLPPLFTIPVYLHKSFILKIHRIEEHSFWSRCTFYWTLFHANYVFGCCQICALPGQCLLVCLGGIPQSLECEFFKVTAAAELNWTAPWTNRKHPAATAAEYFIWMETV